MSRILLSAAVVIGTLRVNLNGSYNLDIPINYSYTHLALFIMPYIDMKSMGMDLFCLHFLYSPVLVHYARHQHEVYEDRPVFS